MGRGADPNPTRMKINSKVHLRDAIVKRYELSVRRHVTTSEAEKMLRRLYPHLADLHK